jgi:hypothetical protein
VRQTCYFSLKQNVFSQYKKTHVSILPKDNYTKSDEILNDLIKF